MSEGVVQDRLKHRSEGKQLFLDATLYKGSRAENLLFRIQHKIADERNPNKGTVTRLNDDERRARIEVEVSGQARLAELGLATIGDLQGFKFRKMRNQYLTFWLPTVGPGDEELLALRKQFRERGLYGTEIMKMLATEEAKVQARALNGRTGKAARFRVGLGETGTRLAWTECNEVVGDALDALARVWERFAWEPDFAKTGTVAS